MLRRRELELVAEEQLEALEHRRVLLGDERAEREGRDPAGVVDQREGEEGRALRNEGAVGEVERGVGDAGCLVLLGQGADA